MKTLRWLLLFVLCIAIPAAFAADVKISALPAASSANTTDEYPANQSGTTNKVTGAQIASLSITNIVTGATGTSGPIETWQTLPGNCATNSTVTMATCMTTNSLAAGTWAFEYFVVFQAASVDAGIRLEIGTTVTFTRFRARALQTVATLSRSNANLSNMAKDGLAVYWWGTRTTSNSNNQVLSMSGVDTVNVDQMAVIEGIFVTTAGSGQLFLSAASELPGSNIQIMADTTLRLRKVL
jgi:hypothetical protein